MSSAPASSADVFRQFGLGEAACRSSQTSAVTSAWGVNWSDELIARDLMQNFFDSNRDHLARVGVAVDDDLVRISGPADFDLRRLFFLGSEKVAEDVGKYGEGFKAAIVCILRRRNTSVLAASGATGVIIRLSGRPAVGTDFYPLVYDFYDLQTPVVGSLLIIGGAWPALRSAIEQGLTHFFFDGNPLVGAELNSHHNEFRMFRSTTSSGYIFYRNLRRGDIPDIPVVLLLNKPYKRIEAEIAQDRDRKAFGEAVRSIFYSIWAQYYFRSQVAQEQIVGEAKNLWQQGRGHPLLAAIASGHRDWPVDVAAQMFGDRFYAESRSAEPLEQIQFNELEMAWQRNGRIKLPSYFSSFGVISARRHMLDLQKAAKAEAREKGAHPPTHAEASAIDVLRAVLGELAPRIVQLFDKERTVYTVAKTEVLLGELKHGRGYHSREVFLASQVFESDFAEAFAVFLHEHAHVYGYDGSRSFTDGLTEAIESLIRNRRSLERYEATWEKTKKSIVEERAEASTAIDELERLGRLNRDELLEIASGLPRSILRSALRRHRKDSV